MSFPSIKLDSITDLPRYMEQDHLQTKLDDKSGYDHILLTEESRTFFGLCWQGWYFVFNSLPFGWAPSAYIYHSTGLAASHFIRSLGIPVTQYIDDRHVGQLRLHSTPAVPWTNDDLANAAIFSTALVLVQCGYFIGLTKSVLRPTPQLTFLGFIADSAKQSFTVPPEKIEKLATLRESLIASKSASVKTLQRFAGKAISLSLAVPAARLYCREVNSAISWGIKSSRPVPIREQLLSELMHWRFLDSWSGYIPWRSERHFSLSISSGASNSGWGGVLSLPGERLESRGYWSNAEKKTSIAVREAKALFRTILAFRNQITNAHVDALVDNTNLLHFWNNEGGRNPSLNEAIKSIFELSLQLNITLHLHFVPSEEQLADELSRFHSDIDCRLSDTAWLLVDRSFGPHTFDLMAIPDNARRDRNGIKLPFYSPFPCEEACATNVFAQELSPVHQYYVFPPFVLIGPLLRFLRGSGCSVSLIAPDICPRKFWWPILTSLTTNKILLGSKRQSGILQYPPSKTLNWHDKPLQWDLWAFALQF
eukprot:gene14932-biopygen12452